MIAKSFRAARSALRDLLQINLDMLIALGPDTGSDSAEEFARKARIAQSLSHLIGRDHFRAIIQSVDTKEEKFSFGLRELARRAKLNQRVLTGDREDLPAFKAFLVSELIQNPFETAVALREADLQFPSLSLPTEGYQEKSLKHFTKPTKREFGLARVVGTDEKFVQDMEQVGENVGPAVSGLAGGRLSDGLEQMIDDYLSADDRQKRRHEKDAPVEIHRLRDALVRFAQKILFVANYDSLLSRDDPKESADKKILEYTQVLQAVGNSILNQADELQARETHHDSLKEGVDRARYSASRLLARTPQQTVAAVIEEFETERVDASSKLETATAEAKKTLAELKGVAKKLNPYVAQDLLSADPLPEPSKLTAKPDGPRKTKDDAVGAEVTLCNAFIAQVINVIATRLTLSDEDSYQDIRSHKPSVECPHLAYVQGLLKRHKENQALAPKPQTHAERLRLDIQNWLPKDEEGNDVQQKGPAVRRRIIDFLKRLQEDMTDKEDPDYSRLEKVIAYLPSLKLGAITPGKPFEVFTQIRNNRVGDEWNRIAKELSRGFLDLKRARTALHEEQRRLNELIASYTDKYKAWTQANQELNTLTARITALEMATVAINGLKASVVAKSVSANLPVDPSATFLLLKTTVADKLAMAKKNEASQGGEEGATGKWQTVWDELDRMNPPTSAETIRQSGLKEDNTSREVLGRLISVLQYEHIEAIRQGGVDGRAENLAAALRAAYEYRARLAFIRPASSYLRSSHPATSLQDKPDITWRNWLKRHLLKSVPLVGGEITRLMTVRHDVSAKVVSQIDRQYWQNINSIRVGGAGETNYVMVQDDIGNWYVKGYSADPKDILKSIEGLSQLVLGRQLSTDLVNRPEPGTSSTPAQQRTALEAVFDKHKAEYERATQETLGDAKTALQSLPSDVKDAWSRNSLTEPVLNEAVAQSDDAEVHLTVARTELEKDDSTKPVQVAQRPARIVMALRAMARYRDRLGAGIRNNIPETASSDEETTEEKAEAQMRRNAAINAVVATLNETVRAKIEHFLKRHEYTAKAYENAIVFVGEIVGQAPGSVETSAP